MGRAYYPGRLEIAWQLRMSWHGGLPALPLASAPRLAPPSAGQLSKTISLHGPMIDSVQTGATGPASLSRHSCSMQRAQSLIRSASSCTSIA